MNLYFARHGESEANILKIFANDGGAYGLTEKGRQQAELLADILVPIRPQVAFASPLLRAQQTAQIVCGRLGIPFETEKALKEFGVGNHEGSCDKAAWDEYGQVEKAWLIEGNKSASIGGGECFNDIEARFFPFIDRIVNQYAATDTKILMIGHGGTFACMLPQLFKNVDKSFAQSHPIRPASLVIAKYSAGEFTCLQWTDTVFEPELLLEVNPEAKLA